MTKNFSILFILTALIVAGFFFFGYQTKVSVVPEKSEEPVLPSQMTFLVLGEMGKEVGWNQSPDLADSIVLVDYRPRSRVVNLVSLPRDLYIDLGNEKFKINEVVRRNKISELLDKMPEIAGIAVDKYVVVDMDILKSIVDGLGGVDIDLDSDVIDSISGFTMKAGANHLNGDDSMWLVRNRFSPEGDFFREKNQHQVIEAMAAKYKLLNSIEKTAFLFKMMPEVSRLKTNLDFQKFMPLVEKFGDIRFNDIVLDFKTGLVESSSTLIGTSSMYILLPKLGENDYTDIKSYIENQIKSTKSETERNYEKE